MRKMVMEEICKNYEKGLEETWVGNYGGRGTIGAIMMNSFLETNEAQDEDEPEVSWEVKRRRQKYFKEILSNLSDRELLEVLDRQHCEYYR